MPQVSNNEETVNIVFYFTNPPFSYRMTKIVAFYAPWCDSCHTIIPKVEAYARRKGIAFEKINVDKCTTERCEAVGYVPQIMVDGRPMSDSMLERILDG